MLKSVVVILSILMSNQRQPKYSYGKDQKFVRPTQSIVSSILVEDFNLFISIPVLTYALVPN